MSTHLRNALDEAKKANKLSPAALAMARAYGDSWVDTAYAQYILQVVPGAMDQLMADPIVQQKLMSMVTRDLNWRSKVWVSPAEWTETAKLFVPGYNAFEAATVGSWLAKFPGIQVQAGREASVVLYVKGDAETLQAMHDTAEVAVGADEVSFDDGSSKMLNQYKEGTNLRLWWD
jgi:hypothetical protein